MSERRYVCVAGRSGSGKETLYKTLKAKLESRGLTTSIHHFSDQLSLTLDDWGIPKHRKNQQTLSTIVRTSGWVDENGEPLPAQWGQEIMSRVVHRRALADQADVVFLDGVRRPADLQMLRTLPGSLLFSVERDPRLRLEGLRKRADRPGDADKTWEQFCLEQSAEPEQMIDQIVAQADIKIENNGTMEELGLKIDGCIVRMGLA